MLVNFALTKENAHESTTTLSDLGCSTVISILDLQVLQSVQQSVPTITIFETI